MKSGALSAQTVTQAPKAAVIVGASAGVGRALAAELAQRGWALVLCATDARDLGALAEDLRLRFGARVAVLVSDLAAPDFNAEALAQACAKAAPVPVEALLLAAGIADAERDSRLEETDVLERLARVNYLSAIAAARAFARRYEAQGRGTIVGFSSIAAHAPRRRNMVYASAKAGLESYFGSLRHYFAGTPVRVQCYALGYVDTALSYGQKLPLPAAAPRRVARRIAEGLGRDVGLCFEPRYWGAITAALRLLPWPVYRRLKF